MATVKLQLKFGTMSGVKTWNINYAKEDATTSDIKDLMDVMIANGSIYKYPPLTKDSAIIIKTEETVVDIS